MCVYTIMHVCIYMYIIALHIPAVTILTFVVEKYFVYFRSPLSLEAFKHLSFGRGRVWPGHMTSHMTAHFGRSTLFVSHH